MARSNCRVIRGVEGVTGSLTLSFPPDKATTALGRRGCPGGLLQSRRTWAFLTGERGPPPTCALSTALHRGACHPGPPLPSPQP